MSDECINFNFTTIGHVSVSSQKHCSILNIEGGFRKKITAIYFDNYSTCYRLFGCNFHLS